MSLSELISPPDLSPSQSSGKASLTAIQDLVAQDMVQVNELIFHHMQSDVPLIPKLAGHLVQSGGKRIRPIITLAAAQLCGYSGGQRHVGLATCVEFIHTATLLHDDVVDESDLRRGKATANALWGNQASVLVGDFLFSRAFQLMVADGSLKILDILSTASAVIAEGEVHQLITQRNLKTTDEQYLAVISAKTAALFEAASQVGAVIAGRPDADEEALKTYGGALGIAFQLVDDALDYSAKQAELGKTIGDDFAEGKITLPVLTCYRNGTAEEQDFWTRTVGRGVVEDGDLAHAIALMEKYDAFEATMDWARSYGQEAKDSLSVFKNSPIKDALMEVVDFCIERAY